MNIGKEIGLEARKCTVAKVSAKCLKEISGATDVKTLCEKYFNEDNWAMQNDFPSIDILKKFKGNSDQYGLHTDFTGDLVNQHKTALFGKSNVKLTYSGFSASVLIVRHNSKAKITLKDNAFVVINVLDDAEVNIIATDQAKANVFIYGEKVKYTITGNVSVNKSEFK